MKKFWESVKVFCDSRRNVLTLITGFVGLSAAIGKKYGFEVDQVTFTATLGTAYIMTYGQGRLEKQIIPSGTGRARKWLEGPFIVALVGCLMPFILMAGDLLGFAVPSNLPAQLTGGLGIIVGVWLKIKIGAARAKNTSV